MSSTNTSAGGASRGPTTGEKAKAAFNQVKQASEGLRQGLNNTADETIKPTGTTGADRHGTHTTGTAGAPGLSSAPGTHSAPGLSSAPGIHTAPGLHSAPGLDSAHGTHSAPGLASAHGTHSAPGLGTAHGTDDAPGLASAHGTHGAPGLGSAPGLSSAHGFAPAPGQHPSQPFADGTEGFNSGRTEQTSPAAHPDSAGVTKTHENARPGTSGSSQVAEDAKRLGKSIKDAVTNSGGNATPTAHSTGPGAPPPHH